MRNEDTDGEQRESIKEEECFLKKKDDEGTKREGIASLTKSATRIGGITEEKRKREREREKYKVMVQRENEKAAKRAKEK